MTWHYTQGAPRDDDKPTDWRKLPRPSTWKYSDPFDHVRHNAWLKSKSQAVFRNEGWELSVEDYFQLWPKDKWLCRGRTKGTLCMIRIDIEKPWRLDNCEIVDRKIACRNRNQHRDNIRNKNV